MVNSNLGGSNLGGGAYNGISPKQTITSNVDTQQVNIRKILRNSWNGENAGGEINGHKRILTPFRAVKNLGDFLGRNNYSCGGPNPSTPLNVPRSRGHMGAMWSVCDTTNVPAGAGNPRFVPDASEYIRYKKERAFNLNYNDKGYGGYNNSAYVPLMHVRRHH